MYIVLKLFTRKSLAPLINLTMHFGKIVKRVAYSKDLSASELSYLMDRGLSEILLLYEEADWKASDILVASTALNYDFGKYLNGSNTSAYIAEDKLSEISLKVRYQKGKEILLQTWLSKIALIAKTIGLEIER
jgi:hypothetical protein